MLHGCGLFGAALLFFLASLLMADLLVLGHAFYQEAAAAMAARADGKVAGAGGLVPLDNVAAHVLVAVAASFSVFVPVWHFIIDRLNSL